MMMKKLLNTAFTYTVIALVGDHYPYTIDINTINEISTYKKDSVVEVNKSNFIICETISD